MTKKEADALIKIVALLDASRNLRNPYEDRKENCPYCGAECDADHVDVGVGVVQCGPYHCDQCGASQMGPETYKEGFRETITAEEWENRWYKGGKFSPFANTVSGELVDHKTAKIMYDLGLLDDKDIL